MKQRTIKLINLTSDLIDHYQSADAPFESEHTVAQELQTSLSEEQDEVCEQTTGSQQHNIYEEMKDLANMVDDICNMPSSGLSMAIKYDLMSTKWGSQKQN